MKLIKPYAVLAFLSVLMAPVPFLFLRFGPRLRRNSKFVPSTGLGRSALQPLITLQIEEKRNMQSPSSGSGGTTAVSSQPPRGIHDTIPSFRSPNPSPTPSRSHTPQPQISGDISVFSAPMETGRRAATRQGEQTTTYGRGYSRGYGDEDFQQREEDEADVGMTERGPLM